MSQSRNRWLINIVLIGAVVSFVGFSLAPLLNASFKQQPPVTSSVTPNPNSSETAKLEERAHGYELVLQREPDNQTALQGLTQARMQTRDLKGAIAPLEKLVALNPSNLEYKSLLAQLKQYNGDRDGAIQVYRSILAVKPEDMTALKGSVGLLLQQNHPESAISLLQDSLKANSSGDKVTVQFMLAQVYATEKRYDEATSLLEETLSQSTTQPSGVDLTSRQLLLAQIYTIQKRYDKAIALYDRAIEANKQDFRPVLAKAGTLKQQGKTEQAKLLFENATALAPAQYKEQIKQMAIDSPTAAPPPTPASNGVNQSNDTKEKK